MRISDWSSDVCSSDLVPPVQGDEGQARLSRDLRRRYGRGYRPHAGHVRRLYRGTAAFRQLRHADELPALQQDEGHGDDRELFWSRRETALRGHHVAFPCVREGTGRMESAEGRDRGCNEG